jgi:hypothetical protein
MAYFEKVNVRRQADYVVGKRNETPITGAGRRRRVILDEDRSIPQMARVGRAAIRRRINNLLLWAESNFGGKPRDSSRETLFTEVGRRSPGS